MNSESWTAKLRWRTYVFMKLTLSNSLNQKAASCLSFFQKEYPIYDRISCKYRKSVVELLFNKLKEKAQERLSSPSLNLKDERLRVKNIVILWSRYVTRGRRGIGRLPCPFSETGKSALIWKENFQIAVVYGQNFSFKMKFSWVFRRKNRIFFSLWCLSFSCCRWMFIEVFPRKLPCPKKNLGYALMLVFEHVSIVIPYVISFFFCFSVWFFLCLQHV